MSTFHAFYHPKAGTVTLVHQLGELRIASTISLATFLLRQLNWPGLYPEAVQVVGRSPSSSVAHG